MRLLRDDGQHPDHHPNQNGQDVNKLIIDFCKDPKSVQEIMDEFDFDKKFDSSFNATDYTIIIGIINKYHEERPKIPFFSKVSLRYTINSIKNMGYKVQLKNIKKI